MKTTDFLQKAKRYIIYANILPKGQHRLYTTPLMIQYTVNTMRFVLMSRITYDEQEMILYDYGGKEPYLTIDYSEIKKVGVFATARIVNTGHLPGQQFHVVLRIICDQGDFEIETCDEDHALQILHYIHARKIPIVDPYNIVKIMMQTKDENHGFYNYMIKHFTEIAKTYGLENPTIDITRKARKFNKQE